MTVQELILQLLKYDCDLSVVMVDEFGKPFQISYCSPQRLDESGEVFVSNYDEDESHESVVSIWPEC